MKQISRNEIRENHINNLQIKYNNLYKDYMEIKTSYEKLINIIIDDTIFNELNDDVELLCRFLYKNGKIGRNENCYFRLEEKE